MTKVAFLIIGTNNYFQLASQCADSITQNIKISNGSVTPIIFTNAATANAWYRNKLLYIDHLPWPLITLLRYNTFWRYKDELKEFDYLYYIDSDMSIKQSIDWESELKGDLVAVKHPGYCHQPPNYWPFEPNNKSTAYVSSIMEGSNYYFGAFQGGNTECYLEACKVMRDRINQDLKMNYIPIWHDETNWNAYCWQTRKPDRVLEPTYAWPENWPETYGNTKIAALNKKHEEIRKE